MTSAAPAADTRRRDGGAARLLLHLGARIGQAVLVLWATFTIVFLAIQALPSDPITIFLNTDAPADPAMVAQLRAYYGYDLPWYEQYLRQLGGFLRLDFGFSVSTGQQVADRIGSVAGNTIALASAGLAISVIFAVVVSAAAFLVRRPRPRGAILAIPSLFSSIPVYWLGIVVLIVFAFQLRIMPLFPDGSLISLLIPATVLAIPVSAPLIQVLLSNVQQSEHLGFVQTARAKGLSPVRVFAAHVLRASVAPAVSVLGTTLGVLIAGSVITETVFARPGLGNVLLKAVIAQDVPLVQGLVLLTTTVVVLTTLVIDLIHPLIDPRVIRGGDITGVGRLGA